MKVKLFWILIIILSSLTSVVALFHSGFFESDDGEWMIIRFSAFHQALVDGQFPVRFLGRLNHGYGYPVANFLYPGFMYFGEAFKLMGFGFIVTIKLIIGFSLLGSAVFCFLWLSKLFDKWASYIGSLLYLYTPYHLFDVYKRGSVGEILALGTIPFVLWQIERKSFFWTTLGVGFLILSHNTLALLSLPIIVAYILARGLAVTIYFLSSIILSFGLTTFFWIPAFLELKHTIFSETQVAKWQDYFADPSLIGVLTIFIVLLTIIYFFLGRIKFSQHRLTVLFLFVGVSSIFLASSFSTPLWNIFPVSFIQFPFRFLSLTIVCDAFLLAVSFDQLRGNMKTIMVVVLVLFLGFSALPYMIPQGFIDKGDIYYATNEGTTTVQNEYMPKWVKKMPSERPREKVEVLGQGKVENVTYNSKQISFSVDLLSQSTVRVNTIYYPGWKAYVDDHRSPISYASERGVMDIPIPSGKHLVKVNFTETPLRIASNTISLLSLFALLFVTIKSYKLSSANKCNLLVK